MSSKLDLKGFIFGDVLVLEEHDDYISPSGVSCSTWLCKCSCGNEFVARTSNLRNGRTVSCGCLARKAMSNSKIKDLLDMKFGKLLVIDFMGIVKRSARWKCICDCGNETIADSRNLYSGSTKSCGCGEIENLKNLGGWNFEDLSGNRYGKLVVIRKSQKTDGGIMWDCECDCGNTHTTSTNKLKSGVTKSCGCQRESFISTELKKYFKENLNAETEYKILKNPKTNQWFKCDIYIPYGENQELNGFYIEIHGGQHYKLSGWHKKKSKINNTTPEEEFEYQKHKDKMKKKYCRKNGYYIEVNLLKIKTVEDAIEYVEEKIKKIIGE